MILSHSCGVSCAAVCQFLYDYGVSCRPLHVYYTARDGERHQHVVTVFEFGERLRVYDHRGTDTLPKRLNLKSRPLAIARAWVKETGTSDRVTKARWWD